MKEYVYTKRSRVFHARRWMGERCNLDDVKNRQETDFPPPDKRMCKHCQRRKLREEKLP